MVILLIFAFISGLLTILAPCIWPLLPIVLSASSSGGRRKPLGITLGIMLSFGFFTLTLSYLVKVLHLDPNVLRIVSVVILIILGLTLLIPKVAAVIEGLISRLGGIFGGKSLEGGFVSGLITGLSLGIVWTPCAGPIFATIATLAATQSVSSALVLVTVIYIVGIGIPLFIFANSGSNFFQKSKLLSPYLGKIQQFFGIVVIVVALGIATNYDKVAEAQLLSIFPSYSNLLYTLEGNKQVQQELAKLKGKEVPTTAPINSYLPDLGKAPEIVGINNWLNSQPLSISSLNGKVVLIDFWTYTCINCIRTLPFVTSWYEKYKGQGLVVIGIHTPEFEFEKNTDNVAAALKMFKINYPVAQDNDYKTWNNFGNSYWPAKYLIDSKGHLRLTHFGEGNYEETEKAIQSLLAEIGKPLTSGTVNISDQTPTIQMTPETYLGTKRMERFASPENGVAGLSNYSFPKSFYPDNFAFSGKWTLSGESATPSTGSSLKLRFNANRVFLVITPKTMVEKAVILLDGKRADITNQGADVIDGVIQLNESRLYELVNLHGASGDHTLEIDFGSSGIELFAFTFG